MKPFALASMAAALLPFAVLLAQSTPTMNQEPHHERLTYLRHMRVFELNLPPGASTSAFVLDFDAATVPLADAAVLIHRQGAAPGEPAQRSRGAATFGENTGAPATVRVENTGTTPYRAMVVENLREAKWSSPSALTAPGTTLQAEARGFAVYDVRLNAATPRTQHVHQNPSFVFLLTGVVQVQGGGGESVFQLDAPGRWFPSSGADQPHTLTHVGTADAHVICVEVK